jgi:hypothetical protein
MLSANPTPTAGVDVPATPEVIIPTDTAVPAQPLPTATPELQGQPLNLGGISMIVPTCLATSASGVIIPEENPGADVPVFAYLPEYRKISLEGYPLSGAFWEPVVQVYPVARYIELAPSVNDTVNDMKQKLAVHPNTFTNSIPLLPIENAAQIFHAQVEYYAFQNGQGIGFLTEYAQYYAPVNNHDIFYTYQGLTADDKYWISAIFPINASYLQPTYDNFTVPADGILPPQDMSAPNFEADMNAYYVLMLDKLNSTSQDAFLPTITCIKQFIQTLNVGD